MGLERLRFVFRLANVIGMWPFHLNYNSVSRTSNNELQFCWKHPRFLWFALLFIGELAYGPSAMSFHFQARSIVMHDNHIPLAFVATVGLWEISYWTVKYCPRLVLFHFARLKKILTTFNNVDQVLYRSTVMARCKTLRRSVIGFVFGLIWIVAMNVAALPFQKEFLAHFGAGIFGLILFIQQVTYSNMTTWLLFIHLIYYSLAYRISGLAGVLCNPKTSIPSSSTASSVLSVKRKEISTTLQENQLVRFKAGYVRKNLNAENQKYIKCGYLFDQLVEASNDLAGMFSLPVLIILITSLFSCTSNLFFLICEFTEASFFRNMIHTGILYFLFHASVVLLVLVAVDMPTSAVRSLREDLIRNSNLAPADETDATELSLLLMKITPDRVHFSAAGMVVVGKHLIPTLAGAIITHLAILFQLTAGSPTKSS